MNFNFYSLKIFIKIEKKVLKRFNIFKNTVF